jgi:hypothetical protein
MHSAPTKADFSFEYEINGLNDEEPDFLYYEKVKKHENN